uniref:FGFR1 oncogene partner (FOP) N-terminal dimerisation domain-containing protein n=1 Tax=Gouania willdenowi TaxID=441366 RepID=A0A8C5GY94_GOUWI
MSAAEDDTELRDLLILNLENSGVLNKIKAEVRAAVFLAMEDQDRLQVSSTVYTGHFLFDGGLAVGLIQDFLQVFNLDFSLSVFQPEINRVSVRALRFTGRDVVCRDLRLSETNKNVPLLLEVVRRGRQRESSPTLFMEVCVRVRVRMCVSNCLSNKVRDEHRMTSHEKNESSFSQSLDLVDEDEGDPFFDDPLPKPQKTYGGWTLNPKFPVPLVNELICKAL